MEYSSVTILLVVSLFGLLCTQSYSKKLPPNCCLPDKFQVFLGQDGGTNAAASEDAYEHEYIMYYDLPAQRWGIISGKLIIGSGDWNGHMLVEDFKERRIIRGGLTPRLGAICRIEQMNEEWEMKRFCLPEDAEFKETVTMGYGDESFSYDIFRWKQDFYDSQNKLQTAYLKTGVTEDCTFVNEIALWVEEKFNNTMNTAFFDLEKTFDPITVFDEIEVAFGICKEDELGELFDVYRTITMQYLGTRVRNVPPPPPPEDEETEGVQSEESS